MKAPAPRFTVTHSEWGEDPYGWQVRKDGQVIDTCEQIAFANAYADFMNSHPESIDRWAEEASR